MSFAGTTADHYARYRRGYPPPVLDRLVDDLRIGPDATVLDLGCGTGLLTVPLGDRVRLAVGADPEPDMLRHAPRTPNTAWLVADDQDLPKLAKLFRPDAVTIAQALHLMDVDAVLTGAAELLQRGRLAIIANGIPLWQQDTEWSRVLLRHVRAQLGPTAGGGGCGTSEADRAAYQRKLAEHGYTDITTSAVSREHPITTDEIVGGLYSALDPELVNHNGFEQALRSELDALGPKTEQVTVHILAATAPQGAERAYSSSSTGRPSP
ncbi:class I SAM-dependent methyltransferase [Labedaea rhizosphaerae]|nr:class I SAM-dependent methyltransferase [Labedaea rhizosphaerae]